MPCVKRVRLLPLVSKGIRICVDCDDVLFAFSQWTGDQTYEGLTYCGNRAALLIQSETASSPRWDVYPVLSPQCLVPGTNRCSANTGSLNGNVTEWAQCFSFSVGGFKTKFSASFFKKKQTFSCHMSHSFVHFGISYIFKELNSIPPLSPSSSLHKEQENQGYS